MATTKKNSQKPKIKTGLMAKLKALVPRKKASPGRAIKNALAKKTSTRLEPAKSEDPAHSPGHRRMQLKGKKSRIKDPVETASVTRSERIAQNKSNQRRVITGAALGKTGRLA